MLSSKILLNYLLVDSSSFFPTTEGHTYKNSWLDASNIFSSPSSSQTAMDKHSSNKSPLPPSVQLMEYCNNAGNKVIICKHISHYRMVL